MDLDTASQLITVAGRRVPYLLCGDERIIWLQAKPLAELLDYSDTAHAVRTNVRQAHRQEYQSLLRGYGHAKVISRGMDLSRTPSIQPATVYVDEPGMWTLMMRSNKPEAEAIQEWVTATVLPAIRQTGSYTIQEPPVRPVGTVESLQMQQASAGFLDCYKTMVELDMATDMDRLFFADLARNAAMPLSRLPAVTGGEGRDTRMLMPISDIVREVTGRHGTKKQLQALGKMLAREYRARHDGEDPPNSERFIDGTTRMVKAYSMIEDSWVRDTVAHALAG